METNRIQVANTETAKQLAAILLQLQKNYPLFFKGVDPNDPMVSALGFKVGDRVCVRPDSGKQEIFGTLHHLSVNRIALMREDDRVGRVCTHFPRLGYAMKRA